MLFQCFYAAQEDVLQLSSTDGILHEQEVPAFLQCGGEGTWGILGISTDGDNFADFEDFTICFYGEYDSMKYNEREGYFMLSVVRVARGCNVTSASIYS